MKLLITGGAGFIGSNLQDKLIELGHQVGIIDNFKTGQKDFINAQATLFEADIKDKTSLINIFNDFKPEVVFHLAAQADVPTSMANPKEDLQINIVGTINVLEACRQAGTKKIIYSNTGGALYGEVPEKDFPVTEDYPVLKPTSFYGVSKLSGEYYVKLYGNLFKLNWVSLRYSNVYGPRQEGNKEAGVVAIFTTKLLRKERPTINGDGLHVRDYIFVSDVVEANLKALDFPESDAFNISEGNQVTTKQVFEAIESELHTGLTPNYGPERLGDARKINLSNEKAKRLLSWEPQVDFQTGIKKTIQFYLKSKVLFLRQ